MAERRRDTDGNYYSRPEFLSCYGEAQGDVRWEAAERRLDASTGVAATKAEFLARHSGLSQWDAALPEGDAGTGAASASVSAELCVTRVDPADGESYSRADFVACYGGTAQWERAAEEHRIDPADSKAYSKRDFVLCYGGEAEWAGALPVSTRSKAAKAAKLAADDAAAADALRVALEVEAREGEAAAAAAAAASAAATEPVTATETDAAKTQQDGGGGRFALPSKKEARKVSVPVPAERQAHSPSPSPSPSPSATTAAAAAAAAAGIRFEPAAKAEPRLARNASSTGSAASPPQSPKGRAAAVPAPVKARAAALASGGLSATPGLEHLQGWRPEAFSYPESGENSLNVVVVGHVDAGKSTLMGHLLYDLGCVPQRTIHKFEKESKAIGKASFHYAWVLDETAEERERGVTMDIATAFFSRGDRRITVLDAPGHAAFQGNTCLGATQADAAILVVNAVSGEFEAGIERGQTREAIYILRGTGIANVIVAVNKLDTVGFSKTRFDAIVSRLTDFLLKTGFKQSNLVFVPTSGLTGVNLAKKADPSADPAAAGLEWYANQAEAPTLAEALERLPVMPRWVDNVPLRLSVSDVMKCAVAGRVETGRIRVGDKIVIQPGNIQTTVKGLEKHQKGAVVGYAGDNVEVSLPSSVDTSQLAIGQAVSHTEHMAKLCQFFEAHILNVADGLPITKSYKCLFHIQSSVVEGTVSRMLPLNGKSSKIILPGRVGAVLVALASPVPVELASEFRGFGRVLLRASGTTVAMGPVTKVYPLAA